MMLFIFLKRLVYVLIASCVIIQQSHAATMSIELTQAVSSFGDGADPFQEDCKLIPFLRTLVNRQILYIRYI